MNMIRDQIIVGSDVKLTGPMLIASSGSSNIADGMLTVVLPLLALSYGGTASTVGLVLACQKLPWLFFSLASGVLLDRVDRRIVSMYANLMRASILALIVVLPALLGGSLSMLMVVAGALGMLEVLTDSALLAMVPRLIPKRSLARVNGALIAIEMVLAEFLGKPLGGVLVAVGISAAFTSAGGCYLLSCVLLFLLPWKRAPRVSTHRCVPTAERSGGRDFVDAFGGSFRLLRGRHDLVLMAWTTGLANFGLSAVQAALIPYLVRDLSVSDHLVGFVLATIALGGLIGSVMGPFVLEHQRTQRTMLYAGLTLTASLGLLALAGANLLLLIIALVLGGASAMAWNTCTVSFRQRTVDDSSLGRINSVYRLVAWGTTPIGALFGGVLSDQVGARILFSIVAALILIIPVALVTIRINDIEREGADVSTGTVDA